MCERMYVLYEEPWDEHDAQCSVCGHVFGYTIQRVTKVIEGRPIVESVVRPVLDEDVLLAGMLKYQARLKSEYMAKYGDEGGYAKAVKRLHEGRAELEPGRRGALLNSRAPSLRRGAGIPRPGGEFDGA